MCVHKREIYQRKYEFRIVSFIVAEYFSERGMHSDAEQHYSLSGHTVKSFLFRNALSLCIN